MLVQHSSIPCLDNLKLHIADAAYVECDNEWVEKNVISHFSRMYYVMGGEGYLCYNGKTVMMKQGNIYFIPLGLKFDYRCDETLKKFYFHINLISDDYIDFFADCKEIISLQADDVQRIQQDFTDSGMLCTIKIKGRIYEDLYKIALRANMKNKEFTVHTPLVEKAILYINTNLSVKLSTKDIAEKLYVSSPTLNKRFSEEMGISIGRYIDLRIQFEAEKLLGDDTLSIEQISEKLGFCDRFYFTRKFKENSGITPAKYRKQAQMSKI